MKFKRRKLAEQLGQAFTKFERAIIRANAEFIRDLNFIETKNGVIFALDAGRLADAYQEFTQAYYKGTLIADATARPSGNNIVKTIKRS